MFGRGSFPRRKSKTVMDSPLLQPLRPAGKRRRRINLANQDTIKCFICQEKFAKYTCPSCNLRYCSVDCFKSQSHSACSESFYKNALLEDFQLEDGSFNGRPQSSQATAMLEILRKIESGQPFSDEDEESADAGSVDLTEEQLNRLSKDELLGFLTQDQIEEFDRKVSTGELDPDFIQATINAQCEDPWWIERQTELPESNPPPPKIHLVQQSLLPALPDRLNPHLFYHLFSLTLSISIPQHRPKLLVLLAELSFPPPFFGLCGELKSTNLQTWIRVSTPLLWTPKPLRSEGRRSGRSPGRPATFFPDFIPDGVATGVDCGMFR
ncbi:hypothetical protein PGTUg99_029013 [Puccinia graminis f. sp. tritici]|uniref:HIT-type domain-containing protein n=1 Tax=Puccinia graminis f. sp. tritici TaxID=56615 RepID=A0A5B0S6G8_PUCGR|nr:hypothetical protein PGTUg99_029013 [Puccinia graminis f. sp. tritici]